MGGKPALLDRREVPGAGPRSPPAAQAPRAAGPTQDSPAARPGNPAFARGSMSGHPRLHPIDPAGEAPFRAGDGVRRRSRLGLRGVRERSACADHARGEPHGGIVPGVRGRLSCAGRAGARARTVAVRTRPAAEPHSLRIRPSAAAASDSSWVAWRTGSACRRSRSRMEPRDRGTSCCREDVRSPWGRLASRSRRHAEARPADRVGIGARSSACTFGGRSNT